VRKTKPRRNAVMRTTMNGVVFAMLLITVAGVPAVSAAPTPAQKCEGSKNDAAGKYAACLGKAQKSFVATADAAKYSLAIGKCEDKYASSWSKAESPGACETENDQADIEGFMAACSDAVADALGGGALPTVCTEDMTCENLLATCTSDLATCDGNLDACTALPPARILKTGQTICFVGNTASTTTCAGTGQDGEIQAGVPRALVDNGDGTVTDQSTGLMWEKLSNDGSVHDKDTQYIWSAAYSTKIAQLNSGSFAGHNDWRLPNLAELLTIADYNNSSPAVDTTFFNTLCPAACTPTTCSCTALAYYWTSTSYAFEKSDAWAVSGTTGEVNHIDKDAATQSVRAVRGGL
jgi:hypothetical protein